MNPVNSYFSSNSFLFRLGALIRFNNWWHSKIPQLIGVFYCAQIISTEHDTIKVLSKLFMLICWMLATASFGYFVNDWSDIEEDSLAGKKNGVMSVPVPLRWIAVTLLFFTVVYIQYCVNGTRSLPFLLSILQLFSFVAYSAPPLRLKRYLSGAILCDSLYAHLLPAVIVFSSVCPVYEYPLPLLLLACWQLTTGVRNILLHHLFDRKNDALSGNNNLTKHIKPVQTVNIINWFLLPIDLLFALLFLTQTHSYLLCVCLSLITFRLFLCVLIWRNKKVWLNKKLSYWLVNDVFEIYLPVVSIALFSLIYLKIFVVLCIVYLLAFPQFIASLNNDMRHLYTFLIKHWRE